MAEGSASLDAEDYAVLGLGTSFPDEGNGRDTSACAGNRNACAEAPEAVHASNSAGSTVEDDRPSSKESNVPNAAPMIGASDQPAKIGAKRRGRPKGYRLSKPTKRKGTGFIDLTGVPPQPLILKNQLGNTLYKDNSRRFAGRLRTDNPNCSKYTGVYYEKKQLKWKAQIMVEGKVRSIGYYDNEEDAAADYARAAYKYKARKPSADFYGNVYGGLDLSGIPTNMSLIRKEGTASGYAGVKRNKSRFEARIGVRKKVVTLGTFDTPEEAAMVYARAKFYLETRQKSQKDDRASVKDGCETNRIAKSKRSAMHNAAGDASDEDPIDPCFMVDSNIDKIAV